MHRGDIGMHKCANRSLRARAAVKVPCRCAGFGRRAAAAIRLPSDFRCFQSRFNGLKEGGGEAVICARRYRPLGASRPER